MLNQVLIVDDDRKWSERILGRYIEKEGFSATIVDNENDAYAALENSLFAFMTVDMNLGDNSNDGWLILEYLADEGLDIPCLVITGSLERDKAFKINQFPFIIDLIDKENFTPPTFRKLLRDLKAKFEKNEKRGAALKTSAEQSSVDRRDLRIKMRENFDLDDIDELCFDLNIDFDDLPGDTKSKKIRGLIKRSSQSGQLDSLLLLCHEKRPSINWTA